MKMKKLATIASLAAALAITPLNAKSGWDEFWEDAEKVYNQAKRWGHKVNSFYNYIHERWDSTKQSERRRTGWNLHYSLNNHFVDGDSGYVKGTYWYKDRFGDPKPREGAEYRFKEKYRYYPNTEKWRRIGYIEGPHLYVDGKRVVARKKGLLERIFD
jgi:hypothetical protein